MDSFQAWSAAVSGAGSRCAARFRAAGVNRLGQRAQRPAHLGVTDAVEDRSAFLLGLEDTRAGERGQVARDHGEVDGAALGDLAHRAAAPALGNAGHEGSAGRIAEGSEEFGVQGGVDGSAARGGQPGGRGTRGARGPGRTRAAGGGQSFAYLRHNANIEHPVGASTHAPDGGDGQGHTPDEEAVRALSLTPRRPTRMPRAWRKPVARETNTSRMSRLRNGMSTKRE